VETLIIRYGIIAIFLGAGIEGEPFALAGGILAHRHWLPMPVAIAAAIGGALLVDQSWFHLSRHFQASRLVESIKRRPAFAKSLALIESHPVWFLALFRFAYGLRAVAPVAIGVSRVPVRLFVALDVIAAIVWGALFTALGYLLGPAFEAAEARYGTIVTLGTMCLSVGIFVLVLRRKH
jgi:membrane protein DedA with SNARE-associated domain